MTTISPSALRPYFQQHGYPTTNPLVSDLQRQLKAMGVDPGPNDGVLGERTLAALTQASGQPSAGLTAALDAARKGGVQLPGAGGPQSLGDYVAKGGKLSEAERADLGKLFAPADASAAAPTAEQAALKKDLNLTRVTESLRRPSIALGPDGQVTARGTAGNDRIMLSRTGDDVRVSIADRDTGKLLLAQKFDAAKVKGLTVDAGAGDDAIENGFRNTRGVDGAVIKPGTGTNLVYNNGAAAHLQGSQDKAPDAVGDIVLNEGARARIDGSSGADHIVSNGVGSRISAASKGDVVVATGRDQQIDVGAEGRVVSNGQNDLRAVRAHVTSSPELAVTMERQAQDGADRLRLMLDENRPAAQ